MHRRIEQVKRKQTEGEIDVVLGIERSRLEENEQEGQAGVRMDGRETPAGDGLARAPSG